MEPSTNFAIVETMRRYGGSFARAIAEAFMRADVDNFTRLRIAFPELWAEYDEMARVVKARATAGQE